MAYILFKHDGIVEQLDYSSDTVRQIKSMFKVSRNKDGKVISPCANCDNCYASKCEKVSDINYERIENYPFIEHGFEIVDNNGIVTNLYIDKCNNFVVDHPRSKIKIEAPLREIRVKQFGSYYDILNKSNDNSAKVLKKIK